VIVRAGHILRKTWMRWHDGERRMGTVGMHLKIAEGASLTYPTRVVSGGLDPRINGDVCSWPGSPRAGRPMASGWQAEKSLIAGLGDQAERSRLIVGG